jgi:hypothetical protein
VVGMFRKISAARMPQRASLQAIFEQLPTIAVSSQERRNVFIRNIWFCNMIAATCHFGVSISRSPHRIACYRRTDLGKQPLWQA